jgi:hypothetical protein
MQMQITCLAKLTLNFLDDFLAQEKVLRQRFLGRIQVIINNAESC